MLFQMLVVLLLVYIISQQLLSYLKKMTQMGGTGIWCRICPQGACNYINAPNKYHFIRTANQITFLHPDVNCKGQMLSQPLDRTGCIESYDIFFFDQEI